MVETEDKPKNGYNNVPIKPETKERLDNIMKKSHTYDSFMNELLDIYEAQENNG